MDVDGHQKVRTYSLRLVAAAGESVIVAANEVAAVHEAAESAWRSIVSRRCMVHDQ